TRRADEGDELTLCNRERDAAECFHLHFAQVIHLADVAQLDDFHPALPTRRSLPPQSSWRQHPILSVLRGLVAHVRLPGGAARNLFVPPPFRFILLHVLRRRAAAPRLGCSRRWAGEIPLMNAMVESRVPAPSAAALSVADLGSDRRADIETK